MGPLKGASPEKNTPAFYVGSHQHTCNSIAKASWQTLALFLVNYYNLTHNLVKICFSGDFTAVHYLQTCRSHQSNIKKNIKTYICCSSTSKWLKK